MALREWFNRLRDRLQRERLDNEIDDELHFHQSMLERDQSVRGVPADEAHRRVQVLLGNRTRMKEDTRAMWNLGLVDDLLQDVRYAVRVLRHNLVFTTAVILTLALGIGANTAIFSVVNAVVLRPLPYRNADQLYSIWTVPAGAPTDHRPTSYPELNDWKAQSTSFSGIAAYAFNRFEMTTDGGADNARGVIGTPGLYEILGATPLIGRMPREDEADVPVVTISHRLWQNRFGADSGIVGKETVMNEMTYTIIGVMPPGFHFPSTDIDLWLSLATISRIGSAADNPWIVNRGLRGYRAVGRLRDGVAPHAAEREMNDIMDRLGEIYPANAEGTDVRLEALRDHDSIRDVRRALWLMLGAAGLVLLLACANVAHLMLARVSTRMREIAIRRALGAHRGRVVRQLLTESLLLGILGGAAGVGVAAVSIRVFVLLSPADIPRLETVALDTATLLFALLVSVLTAAIFGIAPTIVAWRGGVEAAMREQGRSTSGTQTGRLRSVLTAAEVAFALVLLIGAGLTARSFTRMLTTDPGFRTDNVFAFGVVMPPARYPLDQDRTMGIQRVIDAVKRIPGVATVGASTSLPPSRMQQSQSYTIDGEPPVEPGYRPAAIWVPTTPDFLLTLGVPLIAGRAFTTADNDRALSGRVVIINEELARRHFATRPAVGQGMRFGGDSSWTIVGVVGDVQYEGLASSVQPTVYIPWGQSPFTAAFVAVRTAGNMQAIMRGIGNAVHGVDPLMNARELRPLEAVVSDNMVRPRFQTWLLGTFGALALALAAIGIYGVIAYSVAQRATEIGLRLAIGAPASSVIQLLLRRTMTPVIIGLVVGLVVSLAGSRVMESLLVEVSPTDLPTFIVVTLLLALVAMTAACIPTIRATRANPIAALRSD